MAENIISQEKLLGAIDRILVKKSIAARVSDMQPSTGPLGIVLGVQRDKVQDKLIVKRKEIVPETEKIRTEFTLEAMEDMFALYGEDIYEVLAYYLVDELSYIIDEKFIGMLSDRASVVKTLSFPAVDFSKSLKVVGQTIGIAIVKGLSDLPISDNRHPEGFAILSSDIAAIMALTTTLGDPNQQPREEDNSPSYLGTLAGVDYYVDYTNPNNGINSVIFGIKGNGISKGTSILSPYTREWVDVVDSSTGEKAYFLYDRTGMTINPLDDIYFEDGVTPSGFVGKINIDISELV